MKHSFVRRTDGVNLNKANGETEWNSSRVCRNVMNSIRIGEPWIVGSVWNHCGIVTESVANWDSRFLCKEGLDSHRSIRLVGGLVPDDFVASTIKYDWEDIGMFTWC